MKKYGSLNEYFDDIKSFTSNENEARAIERGIAKADYAYGARTPLFRKITVFAAAAVLLTAVTSAAAVGYKYFYSRIEDGENVKFGFDVNRDEKPIVYTVSPTVLPEGFYEYAENFKYFRGNVGDDYDTITVMETLNMAQVERDGGFINENGVKNVIEGSVGDYRTETVSHIGEEYMLYGRDMYVFAEDKGVVVHLWASGGVSDDELAEFASGLVFMPVAEDSFPNADETAKLEAEREAERMKAENEYALELAEREKGVAAENVVLPGESRDNGSVKLTVLFSEAFDGIDLSSYPDSFFSCNTDEIKTVIGDDGKLVPCELYDFAAKAPSGKTADMTFVKVKLRAEALEDAELLFNPSLVGLEKRSDGSYGFVENCADYISRTNPYLMLTLDSMPIGFDCADTLEGAARLKSFYTKSLAKGETFECTILFVTDKTTAENGTLRFGEFDGTYFKIAD